MMQETDAQRNSQKNEDLDRILRRDPGNRGLLSAISGNPVAELRESLKRVERAVLLTGFPVRLTGGTASGQGCKVAGGTDDCRAAAVGETDGPSGIAHIAFAMEQSGAEVRALTDRFCFDQLAAAMKARGCKAVPEMIPEEEAVRHSFFEKLFGDFGPTHLITLERPGKGADGHFHNMRGIVIDDIVTDSQEIMAVARRFGAEIISVGDGGNELGMGNLRTLIEQNVPHGEVICDTGISDIPLVAGVSNWWGWGIAAVLSDLAGRDLIPSDRMETDVLAAVIGSGGLDGCTAQKELTVDRIPLSQHLEMLGAVRDWMRAE